MSAVDYIILFLLFAVLAVLVGGLFGMLTGKSPQTSNRLMVMRVVLQALVILLAAVFLAKE